MQRALKNSFLSFLALFLTSLFICQYVDVRSLFLACSLHRLISSLRHFFCVITDQVSFDSHSFRLLALLPKTSSHDFVPVIIDIVTHKFKGGELILHYGVEHRCCLITLQVEGVVFIVWCSRRVVTVEDGDLRRCPPLFSLSRPANVFSIFWQV